MLFKGHFRGSGTWPINMELKWKCPYSHFRLNVHSMFYNTKTIFRVFLDPE